MTRFDINTIDSPPQRSRRSLEDPKQSLGAIPNLFGVFAESPAILSASAELGSILETSTDCTPIEQIQRDYVCVVAEFHQIAATVRRAVGGQLP